MLRSFRRADALALALLGAVTVAGLALSPSLPSSMAIHFDASGQPDNYVARPLAVVLGPAIGVAAIVFTRLAARFDDGADRLTLDASVVFLGGIVALVQTQVLLWNLGYRVDVTLVVVPILLAAGVLVVFALRRDGLL
jgi:uncharacterized membrane protein